MGARLLGVGFGKEHLHLGQRPLASRAAKDVLGAGLLARSERDLRVGSRFPGTSARRSANRVSGMEIRFSMKAEY
jgi:hypothetical protein